MPKKRSQSLPLECHPLTPPRWDDFEKLFGERGACGGCWCMVWRLARADFVRNKGAGNRQAIRDLVDAGHSPGILGYRDGEPVAWCAVAPRDQYPALERSRVLKPVDDAPVWSVSCLFVRKDCRKMGASVAMLRAAVEFVRERGGTIVEGYPVEPTKEEVPAVFVWTGLASAFLRAGFRECARRSETRPIMRYLIR
ncbi:MAG: GNAT family N-acetyltransferase [Planctomycetes bacterium]|nr:GNAT family N-acetyltransferase [Planctomycetota bacterium]